jgi:predicted transcriptional regulator
MTNDTEPEPGEHRHVGDFGVEQYPPRLRITVQSMDEFFDGIRDNLSDEEPTDEAVRAFATVEQLRSLLTDRRVEVMKSIMANPPESISALADRLGRNYSDVHSDVMLLADHHIVHFDSEGRAKRPVIPYETVEFDVTIRGDAEPASP